jgi:hypothetical protein
VKKIRSLCGLRSGRSQTNVTAIAPQNPGW